MKMKYYTTIKFLIAITKYITCCLKWTKYIIKWYIEYNPIVPI